MNTFLTNQLKDELTEKEKGCGQEYYLEDEDGYEIEHICGHQNEGLCPSCQSKKQGLIQGAKMMKDEILERIEKICMDNQMYADMSEYEFWKTSTISPKDAQKRAEYCWELFEELKKQLTTEGEGKKL